MHLIASIENGVFIALFWGLLAVRIWALADCVGRKAAAFPAAGKLTKPAWVLLNVLSVGLCYFVRYPIQLLSLATLVVSLVYLTDVRPAVREVSGGSRW